VHVRVEVDPKPPANETFTNFTYTITFPNKTIYNVSQFPSTAPLVFAPGENVIDVTFDFINTTIDQTSGNLFSTGQLGNYSITFNFLGQQFSNGTYYLPSKTQTSFYISFHTHPPEPTATPISPAPSPSVPEFPTFAAVAGVLAVTAVSVGIFVKRKKK